ncbi:MAG: SLC13 family permease [Terriglobia bacterium]
MTQFVIDIARAAGKGTDVYLFLTGMMLLAALARREGVFDYVAGLAFNASKGSRTRLFALVYIAGVLVTVFLSNDATAVVLTPAVYAVVKKAGGTAEPYLYACAFVASAASFVLPISNPANLVVYGSALPPLFAWFRVFALPSVVAIVTTYLALHFLSRKALREPMGRATEGIALTSAGVRAIWGIAITGLVLIVASALGRDLGLATCLTALAVILLATKGRGIAAIVRDVSWMVLLMIAVLFVVVEGLNRLGAGRIVNWELGRLSAFSASFAAAALCNLMNNLPAGLLIGSHAPPALRAAVLVGVDLGPNLSVTGSLATVLWLIELRREGVAVSFWTFLKTGAFVMTPALALTALTLSYSAGRS